MSTSYQIKKAYTFGVYAPSILSDDFKNVTVVAMMDSDSASKEIDIYSLHAQVYPLLPSGTPNDPTSFTYLKLRSVAGTTTIVAVPWIKDDTVVAVTATSFNIKIGSVMASDLARVRDALISNGFNSFTISVSET